VRCIFFREGLVEILTDGAGEAGEDGGGVCQAGGGMMKRYVKIAELESELSGIT